MMKLIVAGSRTFKSITIKQLHAFMSIFPDLKECETIVSGRAKGIDTLGEVFAKFYSMECKKFPAEWEKYGKRAGHVRNGEMADYADALLLIWDGESGGSANMRRQMLQRDKPVYEVILKNSEEPI